MQKRRLGRTQMQVTAVSFGALPIQRCTIEEAGPILQYALDKGINFIDTARAYTDSEEKIGTHISQHRDKFYLATKSFARDVQTMQKDIDISLKNLKTDYIDLYQIHNIKKKEELEQVLAKGGALEALLEAKKQGKIKFIGITGHSVQLLIEAVKTNLFDTVQVPYNIVEQEAAKELFPLARNLDMGIIIMKPLGGGQLEQMELSLRFILQEKDVVTIPGMDKIEHIDENIIAAKFVRNLTLQEKEKLEQEAQIVGKNFCRRCGYCLPCAVGIEIPQVFILRLQYSRYGMTKTTPNRYAGLKVKASACIDCGACEKRCPYDLPIRAWLKDVANKLEA